MDPFGNPSDRDIHGNDPSDGWGNHSSSDVHGNTSHDSWGNYSGDGGGSLLDWLFG